MTFSVAKVIHGFECRRWSSNLQWYLLGIRFLLFSDLCTMRQLKYLYPLYLLVVVFLSAFCRFILVTNGHFHLFNTVHWTYFVDVNEQKGNGVFLLCLCVCVCLSACVGSTVGRSENVRGREVVIQGLLNEKILLLKVSQFRKGILVSSNLPKNQ